MLENHSSQIQLKTMIAYALPLLFQASNSCIFFKNLNLEFVDCNQNFIDFTGLKDKNLILGKQDQELPWHENADCYRKIDQNVLEGEEKNILLDFIVATGERKFVKLTSTPVRNQQGNIIGLMSCLKELPKVTNIAHLKKNGSQSAPAKFQNIAAEYILNVYQHYHLTPREAECFLYIIRGLNSKSIARYVQLSHRTVEKIIINLRTKLDCVHKNDLIERAYRDGLIKMVGT